MAARVTELVERMRADVPELLGRTIAFRTDADEATAPPREERAHQELVAGWLEAAGAEVELFEPAVDEVAGHPMYIEGQSFEGRPVLWARVPGSGGGPSLLFNGHYDTVVADPVGDWTTGPWTADVRDGRFYGRGSCDMKGGNAVALALVRALHAERIRLGGDLLVNLVPFEEVNGMGTTATMARGLRADAAVCCEPTELRPLLACRGLLGLTLSVRGRSAHAEIAQPHHSRGGGVSAIDKLVDLLLAVRGLNEDWRTRPDTEHALLSRPSMVNTIIRGGSYWASWPAEAEALFDITYLPQAADAAGYGSAVREEIAAHLLRAAEADSWLRANPPRFDWTVDFPPVEVATDDPFVQLVGRIAHAPEGFGGFDSWADQVMLVKEGGIPTVLLGPGSILDAHTVDESVELASLERCAELYARIALEWCGADDGG